MVPYESVAVRCPLGTRGPGPCSPGPCPSVSREGRGTPRTLRKAPQAMSCTEENLGSSKNRSGWAVPCGVAGESRYTRPHWQAAVLLQDPTVGQPPRARGHMVGSLSLVVRSTCLCLCPWCPACAVCSNGSLGGGPVSPASERRQGPQCPWKQGTGECRGLLQALSWLVSPKAGCTHPLWAP